MNKLRKMLEENKKPLGTFFELGGTKAVEALGNTGLDYIIIDNEHGPFDIESSADAILAADNNGLTPLCRVRETSRPAVLKLLDMGAAGLIVPNINTVDEVKALIEYGKYKPMGNRGFCPTRKDRWGAAFPGNLPMQEQMDYWNKETFIIPQCETVGSLEHIEEICALEGVDGIFVGPFDLSISMGIPGQFQCPEFLAALDRILKAAKANGKFTMIFTGNEDWIKDYYEMGFDMVAYGLDIGMLISGYKALVKKVKE